MIKIIASVRMLIDAVEKYVAGKLLHPCGNVGAHALEGSLLHSKACHCQHLAQNPNRMPYVHKKHYNRVDRYKYRHTIN
jgi:hypothetical protein